MAFDANTPPKLLVQRMIHGVRAFFVGLSDVQIRTTQVRRLASLSDAELAKLGMRREDIVRHVYSDVYYV